MCDDRIVGADEVSIGRTEVDVFAQPPLRSNAEAIAQRMISGNVAL
jgi:hypothetical protein